MLASGTGSGTAIDAVADRDADWMSASSACKELLTKGAEAT